jgi:shikimate dehydrogenase
MDMPTNVNSHKQLGLFLVMGDPIAHSLSPLMHNAAYSELGMQLVMTSARVTSTGLPEAIAGVRALGVRGLAVTMPHKAALCALLDHLDPTARSIGAVNTVTNNDGVLTGFNTDWIGIQRPLEKREALSGRRVAILGAGGAAQAAIYACKMKGASVTILNRNESNAACIAEKHGCSWKKLGADSPLGDFEILINTTPVGMGELSELSPVAHTQLLSRHTVFETIYSPHQTKLIQDAKQVGCTIIVGAEMFLEQGAAQFEIHTGIEAPREAMARALQLRSGVPGEIPNMSEKL